MKAAQSFDPRVDAYINKSAAFAQPILTHLRELVHKAVPEIEEDIEWSMPFFTYHGQMFGNLAAFKAHCSFGLFGADIREALKKDGYEGESGMGSLGKIASAKDLPSNKVLTAYFRQAAALHRRRKQDHDPPAQGRQARSGDSSRPVRRAQKEQARRKGLRRLQPVLQTPEYIEWITEAKRAETREKRVVQAIEWIAEGKQRNWKYQNC